MAKNIYYDPLMGNKYNQMKYRADVVETQLEQNASRARDLDAAKEADQKRKKKGFFARLFKKD